VGRKKRGKKGRRKKNRKKASPDSETPELTGYARLVVETPEATLDLHGLTAHQAERRVRDFIRTQTRIAPGKVVHIITGRGARSPGEPVLPGLVNRMLRDEFHDEVEMIAGLPGGGALAVRLS